MLDSTSPNVRRCLACGKPAEMPTGLECPHCGVEGAWDECLLGPQPPPARRPERSELVSLADLSGIGERRLATGDAALDKLLGGGWFAGESVLIHGPRGSGKSRLSLRWASHLGPALVVCLERAPQLTREVAQGAGAALRGLYPVSALGAGKVRRATSAPRQC